jgi:methylmalonyl-CoA decarboxylase
MPLVLSQIDERLGILTLNHPEKRNCLSSALVAEFLAALDRFARADVRAVLLRALPGSRVWCAGHDIGELPRPGRDPLPYAEPFETLLRGVQDFPSPVVALVEGGVWRGGCDLVFSCDIVVGTGTASFAMTPARIGIPYNPSGMIHFLNVLGLHRAKEMFFTADPLGAEEALRAGILNRLVPAEELERTGREIAARIAANAPLAVRALKGQFRLLSRGFPMDAETFERIQAIRRTVYDSEDYAEGIRAFQEKRAPRFLGL